MHLLAARLFRRSPPARSRPASRARRTPCGRLHAEQLENRHLMAVLLPDANRFPPIGGPVPSPPTSSAAITAAPVNVQVDKVAIPAFSSNPAASNTIYLDFNGFEGVWGLRTGMRDKLFGYWIPRNDYPRAAFTAFNLDNDELALSQLEKQAIERIWAGVAEDYSPFDVNVTTVEPNRPDDKIMQVVIGNVGEQNPWFPADVDGISSPDSFRDFMPNVVFVAADRALAGPQYNNTAGDKYLNYVALSASHEAGHAFGLLHASIGTKKPDGTFDVVNGYDPGNNDISPIMGNGNGRRSLWSIHDSYRPEPGAKEFFYVKQDDVAILRSLLGWRKQESGTLSRFGSEVSGNGVISSQFEQDRWTFETCAGDVRFDVSVLDGINNLDVKVRIIDAWGTVEVDWQAPTNSFNASISGRLKAGRHMLVVAGNGGYGDLGQYFIKGTVATEAYIGLGVSNQVLRDKSGKVDTSSAVTYVIYASDRSTEVGRAQAVGQGGGARVRLKVMPNQTTVFYAKAFHGGVACTDGKNNSFIEIRITVDRVGKFLRQQNVVSTSIYFDNAARPKDWFRRITPGWSEKWYTQDEYITGIRSSRGFGSAAVYG